MTNDGDRDLNCSSATRRAFARVQTVVATVSLTLLGACTTLQQSGTTPQAGAVQCGPDNTITADVVALEQVYSYNRLGAVNPAGLVYALKRDVVKSDDDTGGSPKDADSVPTSIADLNGAQLAAVAGKVALRPDKRPRPLVLRARVGDCLRVNFTNLLSPNVNTQEVVKDLESGQPKIIDSEEPVTRHASMHVNGLNYVGSIESDGANVGTNVSSLAAPGETKTYVWYAKAEGGFLFHSMGAAAGGEGDGGQLGLGLFGSVNVAPKGAKFYRSQVTEIDMRLAAKKDAQGEPMKTVFGQPIIDYEAKFPANHPREHEPILNMLRDGGTGKEIIYSDLNAIVDVDAIGESAAYCDRMSEGNACGKPYREFTSIFHDELTVVQAFPELEDEGSPYRAVRDGMGINYGAAGMGAMVLANHKSFERDQNGKRTDKRFGPAADCAECKLEEFFLSSWANGDPAMVLERDANNNAVKALYPDDPSNVHHSYIGDPVRFRNMHAGPKETHVFHLHAHQWLQDKNDPNSVYLDSQTISPGTVFSYEIQYGGSGNRNMTVGDSIFHCHLYPHFAQGMWELWRSHDVFEDGTPGLFDKNNNPHGRNLPDGEIAQGTPNPAIVPLPRTPLAPMPGTDEQGFRGYPFFIAGEKGHRPPQPPLDLATDDYANDGVKTLRRHVVLGGSTAKLSPKAAEEMTALPVGKDCNKPKGDLYDQGRIKSACIASRVRAENGQPAVLGLARELDKANIKLLDLGGTAAEKRAIEFHAGKVGALNEAGISDTTTYNWPAKGYPTCKLDNSGTPVCDSSDPDKRVLFHVNGQKEKPGAPYADPCPADPANNDLPGTYIGADKKNYPVVEREYRAAYVQFDMKVNNSGWHDPQARIAVLEQDVASTFGINGQKQRAPQPLFFRARSGECITFKATNLIPSNLNLDDFQVFSPTDVIGQHIHLVKFDVTSSDGSGNGWNYEDGTLSADEVRERIVANNKYQIANNGSQILIPKTHRLFRGGEMNKDPRGVCPPPPSNTLDAAAWEAWSDKAAKSSPWCGAQTTIQRWWADPLLNRRPSQADPALCGDPKTWDADKCRWDRTIRTVFTHDHFGPSSHQHHGLYAALVVEPSNSKWTYPDGKPMGGVGADGLPKKVVDDKGVVRTDGGPTSYAANLIARKTGKACIENVNEGIKCPDGDDAPNNVDETLTGREFGLAFADYAIVYTADNHPVNPTNQLEGELPNPSMHPSRPEPEGISTKDPGTQLLNYRNEPIPLRIAALQADGSYAQKPHDPVKCDPKVATRVADCVGDMAFAFSSDVYGDPATPLLRAYNGDRVQLRLVQGAQEENHIFNMHGVKWLSQPGSKSAGWMNAQPIGISEHFEFNVNVFDPGDFRGDTDYLYSSAATDNLWDGQWGLLRAFDHTHIKKDLAKLPVDSGLPAGPVGDICNSAGHAQEYYVSAWHAREVLARTLPDGSVASGAVVYNEQFGIKDPNAILFIEDPKDASGKRIAKRGEQLVELKRQYLNGRRVEPLVIRAAAGKCLQVNFTNRLLTADGPFSKMPDADLSNANSWSHNYPPLLTERFNFNQLGSSSHIGLHTQLLAHKTYDGDGAAVGFNEDSTVAPCTVEICKPFPYIWYAGDLKFENGKPKLTPVEFGVVALRDMADVIKHSSHGAIGALVVEPEDSRFYPPPPDDPSAAQKYAANKCGPDPDSNASATICNKDFEPLFREFVVLYQDDLSLQQDGQPMRNLRNADDAEDTGQKAFNYRTEPLWGRMGATPSATPEMMSSYDLSNAFSSKVAHAGCSSPPCDPATPVFSAKAGMEVRFRVVHPAGHPRNHSFTIFGHDWENHPWIENKEGFPAAVMTKNSTGGIRIGTIGGIGPTRHINIVLDKAGGNSAIPGDYLYRTQEGFIFSGGLWGIFCVYDDIDPKRCDNRGAVAQSPLPFATDVKK